MFGSIGFSGAPGAALAELALVSASITSVPPGSVTGIFVEPGPVLRGSPAGASGTGCAAVVRRANITANAVPTAMRISGGT